jgi:hypothetical protein
MRGVFLAAVAALGLTYTQAQASWFGYYKALESEANGKRQIDWVQYYKMNGYYWPVDAQGNPQRLHFIPQAYPNMQWAVPNNMLPGPAPTYPYPNYPYGTPPH